MERSFFSEAGHIRQADRDAFVLFEPRRNSDVYFGVQPFFGLRTLPTRHLTLTQISRTAPGSTTAAFKYQTELIGIDFVGGADLPHLWILAADERPGHGGLLSGGKEYQWAGRRLGDLERPELLLFGHDYNRDSVTRARSAAAADHGRFSYLRTGAAVLVLPPGEPAPRSVSIRLQPVFPKDLADLEKQVKEWLDRETPAKVTSYSTDSGTISIEYGLPPGADTRWLPVVRYAGEIYVNIRVDDREVATPDDVQLAAESATVAAGSRQRVTWSGLPQAMPDDWVGLFPVNGPDASRVVFVFTGGGTSGSVDLDIPPATPPGAYEWRFYRSGSWQMLGVSRPVTIRPPDDQPLVPGAIPATP